MLLVPFREGGVIVQFHTLSQNLKRLFHNLPTRALGLSSPPWMNPPWILFSSSPGLIRDSSHTAMVLHYRGAILVLGEHTGGIRALTWDGMMHGTAPSAWPIL